MAGHLGAPVPLSTPAEQLFEHFEPRVPSAESDQRPDSELRVIYEIPRTAYEIRQGRWTKIALQFPDSMLRDAPWVVQALGEELQAARSGGHKGSDGATDEQETRSQDRIYILADTSYSACCVDEVAAEHVHAHVIVHYGRSCLSPTSRHPVIYVFTHHQLDHDSTVKAFLHDFPAKEAKVVLMADVTYQDHVAKIASDLRERGYANLLSTNIIHNPLGTIPNRSVVDASGNAASPDVHLHSFAVFHISQPPSALLLALSSRISSLHIFSTSKTTSKTISKTTTPPTSSADRTRALLGRRYARLLSLASAGIIGILVNTLSVANYLRSIDHIRKQIAAAGKKSYTVVVGKLNPAKLANFAEVDGWVVIGCWESSLVEDDAGFFKPVITPFELEMALAGDERRVWTGEWWGGMEKVKAPEEREEHPGHGHEPDGTGEMVGARGDGREQEGDETESEPPQFDLRTGRLISHGRPMRLLPGSTAVELTKAGAQPSVVAPRPKAEVATVNGVVSPGAEYLRSQRIWTGLGSDFDTSERSTIVREGQGGVARGYRIDADSERR